MDDSVHVLRPLLADILRYHNIDAYRQSYKRIYKQPNQNRIASNGCQCPVLCKTARNSYVCGVNSYCRMLLAAMGSAKINSLFAKGPWSISELMLTILGFSFSPAPIVSPSALTIS